MLGPRFDDAMTYAHEAHRTQIRKGSGIPYVSHLLAVAARVIEDGGDEDEAIAALLHDAVEDRGGAARLVEIRARFGETVADLVDACSDTDQHPKPPWIDRKTLYLEHLEHASAGALRISAADKLHNATATLRELRDQGPALWQRFNATRDQLLWYYASVAAVVSRRTPGALADELTRVVTEMHDTAHGNGDG